MVAMVEALFNQQLEMRSTIRSVYGVWTAAKV